LTVAAHALSASYYADQALWCAAEITDHAQIARETYRLRFRCLMGDVLVFNTIDYWTGKDTIKAPGEFPGFSSKD
jgi:hypothetical protein